MPACDRDVNTGKLLFHFVRHAQQVLHNRVTLAGICRGKFRLDQEQDVTSITARDATVHDLRVPEAGLQRHDFVDNERAHADRIRGDDILEHHAFRPGEFTAHVGEMFAHGGGFELWGKRLRIGGGEQIRQRAGQVINALLLSADFDAISNPLVNGIRGEQGVNFIGGVRQPVGIVRMDAHIEIDAVDLVKLAQRVAILVHEFVILRQRREQVLLQINPQRDDHAHRRDQQRDTEHRRPMRHEPHIQTRVETWFHFFRTRRATPYVIRVPNPATRAARATLPASHCQRYSRARARVICVGEKSNPRFSPVNIQWPSASAV